MKTASGLIYCAVPSLGLCLLEAGQFRSRLPWTTKRTIAARAGSRAARSQKCRGAVSMRTRSWAVVLALTAVHVLLASAGCGRTGPSYPPPTPAPQDAISWKAELGAPGNRWRSVSLDVELRLLADGTGEVASLTGATGQGVANLGGVGPIRWEVASRDASQSLLLLTDSSGTVRSFELNWSSAGPWDFISLTSDGGVIKLRRNR